MGKLIQTISALFTDSKDGVTSLSLGRAAFLAVLGQAMWKWRTGQEIPGTQESILMALLAYNFTTKGVSAAREYIASKAAPEAEEPAPSV